jgi:pimeloyl-ACP methyl ester carboxylesterase
MDQFWETPTTSVRDAVPADGRFPIVINHAGGRSSFEDNAVLLEFLASHGYVVLGSAFQEGNGNSFNIDAQEGSLRDIDFLIAYTSRLPQADWSHIGLMGHSAGAQTALKYRAQDECAVDALVSLDTTEDYFSIATHLWDDMTKPVLEKVKNVKGPLLFAARANAIFDFADALKYSERYYWTVKELDHNDFITQGIILHLLKSRAKPEQENLREELERAQSRYTALCEYVLTFLDAYLKEDSSQRARLLKPYAQNPLGGPEPHVDHVRVGVSQAPAFQAKPGAAPTPRQIRQHLAKHGVTETVALLKRCHEKDSTAPVLHTDLGFALVDELLEKGQDQVAVSIHQLYGSFDPAFLKTYVNWGHGHRRHGPKTAAREYYSKALRLDPENKEASEGLKALEDRKSK